MTADGNWIAARLDNQERVPLAHNWRRIDFAGGSAMAIAIPWGDLATAWFSLRTRRSRLWGEVRNAAGERRTAHLETANGYRLTADGTLMAVQFLLNAAPSGGYYTPSMLMGARCVEQLPGSTSIRVE